MFRNYKTIFGEKVFLEDKDWAHIFHRHPEVKRYVSRIRDVLLHPNLVKISKKDPFVHLYYRFYSDIFSGKYLLIVTQSKIRRIITIYVTDKIKVGEVLWPQK